MLSQIGLVLDLVEDVYKVLDTHLRLRVITSWYIYSNYFKEKYVQRRNSSC